MMRIFLFMGVLLLTSASARAEGYQLKYGLYTGGLHVVEVFIGYQVGPKDYKLHAQALTRGLWKSLVPWRTSVHANGQMKDDGALRPAMAIYDTIWRDKLKSVRLDFQKDGRIKVTHQPVRKLDPRREAKPEQVLGSLDPVSAVALIQGREAAGQKGCEGVIAVYDGRRRFDMRLESKGIEDLRPTRYGLYSGPAERCEVRFTPIAGFPAKDDKSGFWSAANNVKDKSPVIFWLAKPTPEAPVMTVRFQTNTDFGAVIAHLKEITPREGAAIR